MKLAYIEDDVDARTIFSRKLSDEGLPCDTYGTAEDFLKAVAPGSYDILIIDIKLPGRSGVQLLKELRQRAIFTPAILITAFNSLTYAHQALNASASYLLEKPFSFTALKRVIHKVLASPQSLQACVDRGFAVFGLTGREEEIGRLLLKGLSNREIADTMSISEKTVKQHITQIFQKAKVKSRAELFSSIFPL